MNKHVIRISLETGLYVGLLGIIVWVAGRPFVFPSLGPTALVLALRPAENSARQVLGGHLCGIIAGLLVYHTLASGLIVTTVHAPFSTNSLWLAASGALSVILTSGGMLFTRTVHAPACATTLIISLGLLPAVVEGGIIMVAVTILYAVHRFIRSYKQEGKPNWV